MRNLFARLLMALTLATLAGQPVAASAQDTIARGIAVAARAKVQQVDTRDRQADADRLLFAGNRGQQFFNRTGGGGGANAYTHGESYYVYTNGPIAIRSLVLVMGNYAMGPDEAGGANAISVEAAVSYPDSSANSVVRATFAGQPTISVPVDGELKSDEIPFYVAPYAQFVVRTGVYVSSGQTWPVGPGNSAGTDNAVASTDQTSRIMQANLGLTTPSGGAGGQFGYAPTAVLARYDGAEPVVCAVGDSLTAGNTGASLGNGQGDRGVIGYGLAEAAGGRVAYNKLARDSATAYGWSIPQLSKHRLGLLSYCTHVVVWLGTNDIGSRTVAQIQGYLTGIYQKARGHNRSVIAVLLPPRQNSSSDPTIMAGWEPGGKRDQVNAWIKAQKGGLVDDVLDFNTVWESATTPGTWNDSYTSDRTHPNESGMQAGKGILSAVAARWRASP